MSPDKRHFSLIPDSAVGNSVERSVQTLHSDIYAMPMQTWTFGAALGI
jgi:hypothetical protein